MNKIKVKDLVQGQTYLTERNFEFYVFWKENTKDGKIKLNYWLASNALCEEFSPEHELYLNKSDATGWRE